MLSDFSIERTKFSGPVLVTGAGGCIGSWVLSLLSKANIPTCAFDLTEDKRRPHLLMGESKVAAIPWITCDISDTKTVLKKMEAIKPSAIIHLAALQVPFCKADPVQGAKVNVVGTVNLFEAARQLGIQRISYASSIAAHGAIEEDIGTMRTLYGAYKYCDEQIARVYSNDWGVHSTGIRPGVVYGVGRDQGLTSTTTVAILAAAAGKAYTVPFRGGVSWLHGAEAASAFIHAVAVDQQSAQVFDMNGVYATVEEGISILNDIAPNVEIVCQGDALAFPMHLPDTPLRKFLGEYGQISLREGIQQTFQDFRHLIQRGLIKAP